MVPLTRRETLLAGAAGLAALAGCNATEREMDPGPEPPENAATDPEHYRLRAPGSESLATVETDESVYSRDVFADAERAAELSFAEVEGADGARAFVRDTDFDAETLLVDQGPVGACYERQLCYVAWSEGDVSLDFGRVHRPWDTACEADGKEFCCWLVRVPAVLDGVSGYARGLSSGACRLPPHIREAADSGGGQR